MIQFLRYVIQACSVVLLMAGCSFTSTSTTSDEEGLMDQHVPNQATYESVACPFKVPITTQVDCGLLTIPEQHRFPNEGYLKIYVATYKSPSPIPKSDPILFLLGGPGAILENSIGLTYTFRDLLADRDLIVFDPRGTGYSVPTLDCPEDPDRFLEMLSQDLDSIAIAEQRSNAQHSCYTSLVNQGINLAGYSTSEIVADIITIREVLNIPQWNIYAAGYGTRLALLAMRNDPRGIRSVILDSPTPLQALPLTDYALHADQALKLLFQ